MEEEMKNNININRKGRKMYGVLILLIMSVILAGCIEKSETTKSDINETIKLKFIENREPLIKDDFSGFKLMDHKYFVVPEDLTLSLDTEAFHGTSMVNASDGIPNGARLYGGSERYNLNDRLMLLQYKVFDKSDKLNDSMNMTIGEYLRAGFKTISINKSLSDVLHGKRIFVLELDNSNKSTNNNTNKSNVVVNKSDTNNMSVIIILFGYDTVLGKVGVQDSKDKSLVESLKILEIALNRLNVRSIEKVVDKEQMVNQSYGQKLQTKENIGG